MACEPGELGWLIDLMVDCVVDCAPCAGLSWFGACAAVDGRSGWLPLTVDGHGCDDAHTYVMRWHVATVQALRLALADDYRGDNSGGVRLTIRDVGHALTPPTVAVPPGPLGVDVPAGSSGVSTPFALQAGTTYRLTATGVYAYGSWPMVADAECSVWPSDRRWHTRSAYAGATGWGNHLDLVVDGSSDWVPATGDDHGCDTGHVYTMTLTPRRSGPVTAQVLDDYLGDNAGALHLTVAPVSCTA